MSLGGLLQIRDIRTSSAALIALANSAKLFHFVNFDATPEMVVAGNGEAGFVLVAEEGVGGATFVLVGKEKVLIGTGGVAAGDQIGVEAGGAGVVAAATDIVNGIALEDAAAGAHCTILATPNSHVQA